MFAMNWDVFLAYASPDRAQARALWEALSAAGLSVFFDQEVLRPGDNWHRELPQHLRSSLVVVVLVSSNTPEAPFENAEVVIALDQVRREGARLIPIRLHPNATLPYGTETLQGMDFIDIEQVQVTVDAIVDVVRNPTKASILRGTQVWSPRIPSIPIVFTGRAVLLEHLRTATAHGRAAVLTQTIQGMGGVGKTTVAAALADLYRHELDIVWWVRSEMLESLTADMAELGSKIGIREAPQDEPNVFVDKVRGWLETAERSWLLIFDNAVDEASIAPYLPRRGIGSVIVTSRNRNMNRIGKVIEVDIFPEAVAEAFLRERVSERNPAAAAEGLTEVLARLGGLPLALEQAAAWVERAPHRRFAQYVALFDDASREPFPDGTRPIGYDHTATTAWRVSIEAAVREEPCSGRLLAVISFLSSDDTASDLLRTLASAGDRYLNTTAAGVDNGLAALFGYSLIQITDEDKINVHRVIQATVRRDASTEAAESAIAVLRMQDPSGASPLDASPSSPMLESLASNPLKIVELSAQYGNKLESAFSDLASDLSKFREILPEAFAGNEAAYTAEGIGRQRQVLFVKLEENLKLIEAKFAKFTDSYLEELQALAPSAHPEEIMSAIRFYRAFRRMPYLAFAILYFWILISRGDYDSGKENIGANPALRRSQDETEAYLGQLCEALHIPTGKSHGRILIAAASTDASALTSIRTPLYPKSDPIHHSIERISIVLKSEIPPRIR